MFPNGRASIAPRGMDIGSEFERSIDPQLDDTENQLMSEQGE